MSYLGRESEIGSFKKVDSISALQNNTSVIFPLTITSAMTSYDLEPVSPFSLLVVKNGDPLEPNIDYAVLGNTIIFALPAPLTTDIIWITTLGEPINIGIPEDGVITDGEFAQGSVTDDKLTQQAQDLIIGNIIAFGI